MAITAHRSLTSGVASGGEVEWRLGEVVEHPWPRAALGLLQHLAQAVQPTELSSVVHDAVAAVTCNDFYHAISGRHWNGFEHLSEE